MIVWGDWVLTADRVAVHRDSATAVVADLHLGYALARRLAGEAVPIPPLDEVMDPLGRTMREFDLRSLVIAGDLFEKGPDKEIVEQLLSWLATTWIDNVRLVPGNHDRGLNGLPSRVLVTEEPVRVGEWRVIHGDEEANEGKIIQGHLHPALRVAKRVPLLPCYLADGNHLILPAYSAEAKGVDVSRDARWQGYRRFVIVEKTVGQAPSPILSLDFDHQ